MEPHATSLSASSDISVGEDSTTFQRKGKIRQWIQDIDGIDNATTRSSVAGADVSSTISSQAGDRKHHMDGTTYRGSESEVTLSKLEPDHLLPDDDMDGLDDFFVEAAQQALEKGRSSFDANDYDGAAAYLREALTMIKGLTVNQQTLCDTWELRRMLGVCAFHVYEPVEAEAALLSVLDNAPKNAILGDARRLQISETAHFLGQTYVKVGDLDKAYRYGEYALRGRRRVLGKSHEQSYESLALMARILDLQGNSIRAEFFVGMIPEDDRQTYLARFESLSPPPIPRVDSKLGSNSPVTPLEKSLDSALQEATISTPETFRQEHARSVSALSGPVSAVASDSGDGGTWLSVSRDASPEPSKASRSVPALVIKASGEIPRSHPNRRYQLFPDANLTAQYGRPVQQRSVSDQAIHPAIPELNAPVTPQAYLRIDGNHEPADPQLNPPARQVLGRADLPSVIHQAQQPRMPEATGLYPQPLRPQRQAFVSELPGDTHFSVALGSPPSAPLPYPPVRTAQSSLPQEISPPALPQYQAYSPPVEHHSTERRSTSEYTRSSFSHNPSMDVRSTSEYTRSSYSQNQSMDIRPDMMRQDAIAERKSTDHPKGRKTSLLKMFRAKSAATESSGSSITGSSPAIRDYTTRLSYHDMSTIKSEAITENVIEFWQEHLEHELIQGNTKYVLMRPVRCYFLINEAEITPALKATLPDFQNTVHVLIPLRSHFGHWSLLLISSQDELACHYDPHTKRNRALAERVTKRISSFLEKPLKFLDVPDTPDQPHDKDSGIFVCFFMQHLVEKLQKTHVSQKVDATLMCKAIDVKAARKTIHKTAKAANPPIAGLGE